MTDARKRTGVVRLTDCRRLWPITNEVPLLDWVCGWRTAPGVALVLTPPAARSRISLLHLHPQRSIDVPIVAVGAATSQRSRPRKPCGGAADYLALPDDRDVLRGLAAAAVARRREVLAAATRAPRGAGTRFREIIGDSPRCGDARARARCSPRRRDVLIREKPAPARSCSLEPSLWWATGRGTLRRCERAAIPRSFSRASSSVTSAARSPMQDAKPGLFEAADGGRCSSTRSTGSRPSCNPAAARVGRQDDPAPRRDAKPPHGRAHHRGTNGI